MHAVLARQIGPDTWLLLCHLISVVVDAGIAPVESLEGPKRTLALMRYSMSSSGPHSGPSFVVSHSAFSSLPNLMETRSTLHQGNNFIAASASGCFQLACLFLSALSPTRATSISRFGGSPSLGIPLSSIDSPTSLNLLCASLAAPTIRSVSIARTAAALATLGAIARYCAKKAIGNRRCVGVTSTSPAILGERILLMV